jgi:hypothetical protein
VGQYAERAAGQTDRLSEYLHDKEASQLIGDVEDFARSRPSVFLGGAFVLGIAAARFLKSSSGGSGGSGQGGSQTSARTSARTSSPGSGMDDGWSREGQSR